MADYYPLLARALDALPDRSPALRKAVYDRARSALIGQLRSLDPPVSEPDIDLERKALDSAIERLEIDYGPAPKPVPEGVPPPAVKPVPPPPPESSPPSASAPPLPSQSPEEATPLPRAQPLDLSKAPAPEAPSETGPAPEFVPFMPPPRKQKPEPAPAPPPPVETAESPEPEAAEPASLLDPTVASRRPRIDVVAPRAGRSRLLRNVFVGAVLVMVIGLIAVAAFLLRDRPADLPLDADNQPGSQSEQPESKFADRVGGEGAQPEQRAPSTTVTPQPDLTVAQRAVFYEENTSDPKATPNATTGRAIWRVEPVNGEQGQPLQSVVRANVEFPEAGLALTMTIRKNLDATLPASHTIELAFSTNNQSDGRLVQDVGLLQLKDEQNARGSPVSGLPVRVRDNFFLIGLSNLPNDVERNTDLLTRRNWLDLAFKFKSGQRAVISFDKGASGTQVMQSAFDQWRE